MTRYAFVVGGSAQHEFAFASAQQQRLLLDRFRDLAAHPFRQADFFETDSDGRKISVVSDDEWLISYWVDHAIQRVVIAALTFVDGA